MHAGDGVEVVILPTTSEQEVECRCSVFIGLNGCR